ncbi:MAG TPA: PilZ domain-containing protein [Holophaga sp.]|nr:PilZ domain-containing protein [Holophaga sp.]
MDRRSRVRIPTASHCAIRFVGEDRVRRDIRVANLGTGGCCLRLAGSRPGDMEGHTRLECLELDLPGMPQVALRGQVMWWRPVGWPRKRGLEAGVQFQGLPPSYAEGLGRLVKEAGPEEPFWMRIGMP